MQNIVLKPHLSKAFLVSLLAMFGMLGTFLLLLLLFRSYIGADAILEALSSLGITFDANEVFWTLVFIL